MKRLILFLAIAAGVARGFSAEPTVAPFRAVNVDTGVQIGYGLAIADIDGDKKPDIVLVDKNTVAWYRNPTWEKHVMAANLTDLDNVCIAAADIDGDGKAEVAIGAGWNPGDTIRSGAVFYLVPPKDRTQRWTPVKLHHEPTVHRMHWVRNARGRFDLVVLPLHGRGNKDGQGDGARMLAYHMPLNPSDAWSTTILDASLHKTHNFDPVQWDQDAAQEMLVCGREGIFLLDGKQPIHLGGAEPGAGEIRLGHTGNGRRIIATIEPMHGNQCVVYTEPQTGEMLWHRHVIDESLVDGHAVACGDVLKLGSDQIVVGWRAMNRPGVKVGIRIYTPADSVGLEWKPSLIDDNTMACEDLKLADLDGDGRLDIIAAGRATKNLKIYFNEGAK
jgi:hypothetical protein